MLRPRVGPVPRCCALERWGRLPVEETGLTSLCLSLCRCSLPFPVVLLLVPCRIRVLVRVHVCTRVQVCMCLCLCAHACMCARGCMCASACVHTHAYSKPHNTLLSCVVFVACATFMFTMAHVASPVNPLRQAGITTALHTERGRDCVRL